MKKCWNILSEDPPQPAGAGGRGSVQEILQRLSQLPLCLILHSVAVSLRSVLVQHNVVDSLVHMSDL